MNFVDTHCHCHWPDFGLPVQEVIKNATQAGVGKLVCIGTSTKDSQTAVQFAGMHDNIWASVGVHPHYASAELPKVADLKNLTNRPKVVAIGECGLDYYYHRSPKADQEQILNFQLQLAQDTNLPVIFHVRDAFNDFWPIVDNFRGISGVFHCFSAGQKELDDILKRDFYVGVNGIATFSKNAEQIEAFKSIPLGKMLLETDAPYLTPAPLRGKINQSMNVVVIARFLSALRGESLLDIANQTTHNANKLFGLKNG